MTGLRRHALVWLSDAPQADEASDSALAAKWPNTSLADNPRFSVAEGFGRFALGLEQYRSTQGA